jgi:hypothetical protein
VSRFINFLKPVLQNEIANPTWGSLLLKIRDVLTNDTSTLAAQYYLMKRTNHCWKHSDI